MQIPVRITFRHMETSAAVESRVRELADKLTRVTDKILDCHVTIEAPPARHHKGSPYSVRIDLAGPGGHLTALKGHDSHPEHKDVYVALRDAFDAIRRQLDHSVQGQRERSSARGPAPA
jgi:ribosome-associated translation inhibitor RaiA